MTDELAIERFAAHGFGHQQHLRFAFSVLRARPGAPGREHVAGELRRFAAAHDPGRYHETLTRFWIRVVEHAASATPGAATLDQLLTAHAWLADPRLPERHYRTQTLWSDDARRRFVEPDRRPLPAEAA